MRWRLILKEFGPELKYIKGKNNVVADALAILEMSDNQEILNISEICGYDYADMPGSAYPICYHNISKAQKTNAKLKQKLYPIHLSWGRSKPSFNIPKYHNMLTCGTTKEDCRLVSRDDLSSRREFHRTYPPSTFWLKRPSQNSPQYV